MSESKQETPEYMPPRVWSWDKTKAGTWGSTNRPISGATHDAELNIGDHPFQLYSMATPNGQKVSIMFEELLALGISDAEYDAHYIDISTGDQFGSDFVEINPNSKIPALVDLSNGSPIRVFESGAILLYLADKFNQFIPEDPAKRAETLNWLFWLQGSAPYLGGGFGHFYYYAPEKIKYAIDRFTMEAKRLMHVLETQLAENEYITGDEYTIADIAVWPWFGNLARGLQYDAGEFLSVADYPNLIRWAEKISQRAAVQRGRKVNRTWGEESEQLRERHSAADFD